MLIKLFYETMKSIMSMQIESVKFPCVFTFVLVPCPSRTINLLIGRQSVLKSCQKSNRLLEATQYKNQIVTKHEYISSACHSSWGLMSIQMMSKTERGYIFFFFTLNGNQVRQTWHKSFIDLFIKMS